MKLDSKNTIMFLCAVLIILIGFSYYLSLNNQMSQTPSIDTQTARLENVTPKDDTETIENELEATNFSEIDIELDIIESQLE